MKKVTSDPSFPSQPRRITFLNSFSLFTLVLRFANTMTYLLKQDLSKCSLQGAMPLHSITSSGGVNLSLWTGLIDKVGDPP
jgi:hypothetical protein